MVELKAIKPLSAIEEARVIRDLKATGFHRALLINFGSAHLETKRLVHSYLRESAVSFGGTV